MKNNIEYIGLFYMSSTHVSISNHSLTGPMLPPLREHLQLHLEVPSYPSFPSFPNQGIIY